MLVKKLRNKKLTAEKVQKTVKEANSFVAIRVSLPIICPI
jgi:hypothetical protein